MRKRQTSTTVLEQPVTQQRSTRTRKSKTQAAQPVELTQVQLLDIPEVARRLCIGRTTVYELIKTDGLPTVKIRGATRVSVGSLQRWIAQREQAS